MNYDDEAKCRAYLLNALAKVMDMRHQNQDTWIEDERLAITIAANLWAKAHALPATLSVADVEEVEQLAVGHVDYARKLALYVTEMIYGHRPIAY